MGRAERRGSLLVTVALVALIASAPGCTPADVEIAVAGLDSAGTPVVGAQRCAGARTTETWEAVVVRDASTPGAPVLWRLDRRDSHSPPDTSAQGSELAPPPADPAWLGPVGLIAVGDPDPTVWTAARTAGPLPSRGALRIDYHAHSATSAPTETLSIDLDGGADRYQYVAGGSSGTGVTAVEAAEVIAQECDDTDAFDGGRFALVAGAGAAVLLALAVLVGVVSARQYRRAGEARTRA